MPQSKLDAISQKRQVLPFSPKKNRDFLLQLQLQKEVDRLAVLLDEVREQSARVQAAADAIGDKFLSEQLKDSSTLPQGNGAQVPLKMDPDR
jgi:hypothetical protein